MSTYTYNTVENMGLPEIEQLSPSEKRKLLNVYSKERLRERRLAGMLADPEFQYFSSRHKLSESEEAHIVNTFHSAPHNIVRLLYDTVDSFEYVLNNITSLEILVVGGGNSYEAESIIADTEDIIYCLRSRYAEHLEILPKELTHWYTQEDKLLGDIVIVQEELRKLDNTCKQLLARVRELAKQRVDFYTVIDKSN